MDATRIRAALAAFCETPGRAAHVMLEDGREFGVNADVLTPAASVAKVAIVMTVLDAIAQERLDGARRLDVSLFAETRYCSILKAFDAGATLSLREACRLAIITSDNPLMVSLQALVSPADIRTAMDVAGVSSGAVVSAGFSEAELGPPNRVNVMTARDASLLLWRACSDADYADLRVALENNLRNTRMPRLLPDEAVVAHKTGSLAGVVNDAGVVSCGGARFALSCLSDGQADVAATEDAIARCAAAVLDAVSTSA